MRYHLLDETTGRIKRGGYIFQFWLGDHPPRHVHVYRDGRFIAKVECDENFTVMWRKVNRRLLDLLKELRSEGLL